jgi:ferritin
LVGAYEHELFVTASINNIYEKAASVKDYRTMQFLDWFIQEQMEEEKNTDELIRKYELYVEESKGLYQLNQEFGARVYAPPTLVLD